MENENMRDDKANNFKFGLKHFFKRFWRRLKREFPAFFIFLSLLTGATFFSLIANEAIGIKTSVWPLIAVSVAIMNLPKTFGKNKANDLYTIRFARAFRDGFVPMYSVTQSIQEFVEKVRSKHC
jgi:hypothetical protein